ncbi:hypothetical protein LINPERPRIM_LOCUS20538, partial [Linum perenne]
RKKKEKSGRVRHLGFGAKSKKVYRGSSSSSGSQEPSNPNLPSWAEFGQKFWSIWISLWACPRIGGNAKNVREPTRMWWKRLYLAYK